MIFLRFLTEKYSLESALIRFGTRSEFSHVEFVRTADMSLPGMAAIGDPIDTLGSRLEGGVRIRPYNYCKPTREEWYTAPNIEGAYRRGLEFIGYGYDWRDIAAIALNKNWVTKRQEFICSRFCFYCNLRDWALGGGQPWLNPDVPSCQITPRDLPLSPFLKRDRIVL